MNLMRRPLAVCLVVLGCCLAPVGCNGEPTEYPVRGAVTYQGTPVAEGEIIFAAADGSSRSSTALIKDGRYELKVLPGEKQVRITASKETGKILEGAMGAQVPERVDLIPAQYNTQSTLKYTVKTDGENVADFKLE